MASGSHSNLHRDIGIVSVGWFDLGHNCTDQEPLHPCPARPGCRHGHGSGYGQSQWGTTGPELVQHS